MRTILAVAAIVVGMGTAADAAAVGSAPAYGGTTQTTIVCYYSNIGATAVTFSSSIILVEPGTAIAEAQEFCSGAIPAGGRCRTVSGLIVNDFAHWCKAVVDSKASLRGRMEIRNSSGVVLSFEEIR